MSYGLPSWLDPMEQFGNRYKTMDDINMAGSITRSRPTAPSRTQTRMNQIYKSRKGGSQIGFTSLSPAQQQQQVQRFSQSVTKTEQQKKPKMDTGSRYSPGTLGRRYKGKYVTVPVAKGTSRRRYVDHAQVEASHCLYTVFNDMGPRGEFIKTLAESILLHYMHRVGDFRVNLRDAALGPTTFQTTTTSGTVSTWKTMRLQWRLRRPGTESMLFFDLDAWSLPDHAITGDDPAVHATFTSLVDDLASNLLLRCEAGYELASITMFRGDRSMKFDGSYLNHIIDTPILHDTSAGRNIFKFSAAVKFKIQNTTDADAETDIHNKDNIHANPLDGLVYKFKNLVPKIQPSFMSSIDTTSANVLNNLESQLSSSITGVDAVALSTICDQQFHVPPPLPYTIFANSAGRSKILIKPGEHRTLSLRETFSGSVNQFFRRYIGDRVYTNGERGDMPPGGNCLMIALKPTFRTGTNEDLEIQYEVDRTLHGLIQRKKLTTIPITNIMS